MAESPDSGGFLARWGRRKTQARAGEVLADAPPPVAAPALPVTLPVTLPVAAAEPVASAQPLLVEAPPPLGLADVALLTRDSDYARFVASGVDEGVKRAAMKKLFSDPHFNVMDGLDIYIDDYTQADPIPLAMLREMNQSKALKLFEEDDEIGSAVESGDGLALAPQAEAPAALEAPNAPNAPAAPTAPSAPAELAAVIPADPAPADTDTDTDTEVEVEAPEPKRAP